MKWPWTAFILLIASLSNAKPAYYISSVRGIAWVWSPWSTQWEAVTKGLAVWEDSLLQVQSGGKVQLALNNPDANGQSGNSPAGSSPVFLSIEKPTVLRVNKDALRKSRASQYFAIPPGQLQESLQSRLSKLSLETAWNQVRSLAGSDQISNKDGAYKDENRTKEAFLPLYLYSPTHRSVIHSKKEEAEVSILWKPIGDTNQTQKPQYDVFVWKENEARSTAIARTELDHYTVTLSAEARYWFQIESNDRKYRSKAHLVRVTQQIPWAQGGAISQKPENEFGLELPQDKFQIGTRRFPTQVSFTWKPSLDSRLRGYRWTLYSSKGEEIKSKDVSSTSLDESFAQSGVFQWRVEAKLNDQTAILSESRLFSIQPLADLLTLGFIGFKGPFVGGVTFLEGVR